MNKDITLFIPTKNRTKFLKRVIEYYNKIRKQPKEPKRKEIGLKAGHIQPWCAICNERRFIHIKRFKLELSIFNSYNQRWQCQDCRKIDTRKNMIRN